MTAPHAPVLPAAYAPSTEVLDALNCHLAVLDRSGRIVFVNAAWNTFAERNGGFGVGVGANYHAVCASAGDPEASEALAGLLAVGAGRLDVFTLEYACPGPSGPRWYRMTVNRFADPAAGYVVVRHDVIVSQELARDNAWLRAVTERMGEGLCTLDADGRIDYVNPEGERLLGAPDHAAVGGSFVNRLVGSHPDGSARLLGEQLIGAEFAGTISGVLTTDRLVRVDGSIIPIEYVANPLPPDPGGSARGWVVVFRDISERVAEQERMRIGAEHARWMGRIQAALETDRFVLLAQPIVDLSTGITVHHELLLRLDDPDEGLIAPSAFLPTAEAFGLAPAIDRWVIARAVELAAAGHPVQCNLSARSLGDPSLPYLIEQLLRDLDADPRNLGFEITETAMIDDGDRAVRFAQRMRALGCRLALDDFGTGYGAFSYLKHIPVDQLKIDIEFVRDAGRDPASRHVIDAVVALAKAFDLVTVAEGVEDAATLRLLREMGVDQVQGFHLGRPVPLALAFGAPHPSV